MSADPRARPLAFLRRPRGRWVGLREFAIFAAAYLTYFGVRALTEGSVPEALANAARIAHVERLAGVDWEDAAQSAILGHDALVRLANWVYIFGHWPLLLLAGVLLFRYRRREYHLLRDVCLISGAGGLIIFALFPVAPPRLAGSGVVDTITYYAGGYRTVLPSRWSTSTRPCPASTRAGACCWASWSSAPAAAGRCARSRCSCPRRWWSPWW